MKTRFAVAIGICVFGLCLPGARAFISPKTEPLKNYDKRDELSRQTPDKRASLTAPGTARSEAAAALQSRVPQVRIKEDKILGTPRHIAATHGFLTGAGGRGKAVSEASLAAIPAGDRHRVIKAFLNEHAALVGHDAGVLNSARVQRDFVTKHNGLRTVVWQQMQDDIPVFDALLVGHVTRDDELVSISDQFVADSARAAEAGTPNRRNAIEKPRISHAKAVVNAAADIGVEVKENSVTVTKPAQGAEKKQTLRAAGLRGRVEAQLVWMPMNRDSMRLSWRVLLSAEKALEHYMVVVDAETGEVLVRRCLTAHLQPATYNVFTSDSPSPFTPGWEEPYTEQPPLTERTLVTYESSALEPSISLAGWIPDGLNRPTTGNNADAFRCRELNINPVTGEWIPDVPRPRSVGTNRVFDYSMNLTNDDPLVYADASTVQLFWRANWYHDRLYQLGFTESAGNFQTTNFGLGGLENDEVICLVQAGADWGIADNSMFYAPPDGYSGECYMFVFNGPNPNRDGSLDQEVVVHELTHGLSGRLLGGGVGITASQSQGMGEGWSDFYALALLSEPSDDVHANYPIGGYASYLLASYPFEENYYYGIRRYPYSTTMSVNPLTFKDIDPSQADSHYGIPINPLFGGGDPAEVHNQGEVWCVTLWEMRANLIDRWGWEIGNELALQLVTDGLKLAPANANFLEARDAIILADEINSGGENAVELWNAFAKRGMGLSASCPASDTTIGVQEAYDGPIPDGILEVSVTPAPWSSVFTGDGITNLVRVTDARPITNATITARIVGSTNLIFRNDGVAPDQRANDGMYTTFFMAPASPGTLTVELVVSAPAMLTATNNYTYFVVAVPPNDNFASAIKVPGSGTNYVTNNKRATVEPNEPDHGGSYPGTTKASLWWSYKSDVPTNVLVDSAGSSFISAVAVYTNNTLSTLGLVTSATGSNFRKGAYVSFNALAGVVYRIAVASVDAQNVGTVFLNVEPSGWPDTNAPLVSITDPPSGIVVSTNRLVLSGTAVDQGANPTGIKNITFRVSSAPGLTATTVLPFAPSFNGPLATNWSAIVGVFEGLNTVEVFVTDFAENRSARASIQATYRPLDPPNDFFVNAIWLTNNAGTNALNTLRASKEAGEPNHAGNVGGKSAWWFFTAPADGVLVLSTSNSTFDTVLAVYTGTSVGSLTPVASNDDAYDGAPGGFSRIAMGVLSGQTYRIALDGYDGLCGAAYLTYQFTPMTVFRLTVNATAGGSVNPSSMDAYSNSVVALTAIPSANYLFDMWDGSAVSLGNPLSLVVTGNMSVTARFRPIEYTDGFESGTLTNLGWTSGGNKPWIVQTNYVALGKYAARSGVITHNQSSSLILTANFRAGNGSFCYRVSSEQDYDFLRFHVDGIPLQSWSGAEGWASFNFPLAAGTHTLEWRYVKDSAGSAGLDAAFLDNVSLPLVIGTNAWSAANLQLRRQMDGSYFIDLTGQTNQQYVLQGSTNLINWRNLSTNIAAGGFLRIPDPASVTNQIQFYRAVVVP
jgi:hypothetical protein